MQWRLYTTYMTKLRNVILSSRKRQCGIMFYIIFQPSWLDCEGRKNYFFDYEPLHFDIVVVIFAEMVSKH